MGASSSGLGVRLGASLLGSAGGNRPGALSSRASRPTARFLALAMCVSLVLLLVGAPTSGGSLRIDWLGFGAGRAGGNMLVLLAIRDAGAGATAFVEGFLESLDGSGAGALAGTRHRTS